MESHPISDYLSDHGLRSVSASNIIAVIRAECLQVGASRLGFAPEDVGTHSLRSGRAMVMHLAEVPNRTLMAIGRWRSLDHLDREPRAEGRDLLLNVDHESQ